MKICYTLTMYHFNKKEVSVSLCNIKSITPNITPLVMLLRHIGFSGKAEILESILNKCDIAVTGDKSGATCQEYGNSIIRKLKESF